MGSQLFMLSLRASQRIDLPVRKAMGTHLLDEMFGCCKLPTLAPPQPEQQQQHQQERKPRPQPDQALRCPRCDSTNTKFCYYNNYSLSQPRYFCKGCRRYWTKGGTLRNVPVGGGCRKNKRPSSSCSKKAADQAPPPTSTNPVIQSLPPPPPLAYDPNDLTLAFAGLQKQPSTRQLGLEDRETFVLESSNPNPLPSQAPGFLDILRSGLLDNSTCALNNLYYGLGGHGNLQEVEGEVGGGEQVLPFEGLGDATATVKREPSYSGVGEDNKLFMGLQWPAGGDGNMVMDPGRDYYYWNGVGSTWQGLVHSSLI